MTRTSSVNDKVYLGSMNENLNSTVNLKDISDIKARANSMQLEKLTLNAWAQFGAGVKKSIGERVTCFAENIIRTGGRVGWGFMLNLQIKI